MGLGLILCHFICLLDFVVCVHLLAFVSSQRCVFFGFVSVCLPFSPFVSQVWWLFSRLSVFVFKCGVRAFGHGHLCLPLGSPVFEFVSPCGCWRASPLDICLPFVTVGWVRELWFSSICLPSQSSLSPRCCLAVGGVGG